MYVGELCAGAIIFHARWGLGRVVRMDEACAVTKFGTRRHKLAMNDTVAVWATHATMEAAVALPMAA